jgi:hypothetical protein
VTACPRELNRKQTKPVSQLGARARRAAVACAMLHHFALGIQGVQAGGGQIEWSSIQNHHRARRVVRSVHSTLSAIATYGCFVLFLSSGDARRQIMFVWQVARALLRPPEFRADKLSVAFVDAGCLTCDSTHGAQGADGMPACEQFGSRQQQGPPSTSGRQRPQPQQRRYTITHNDLTGDLQLTVGRDFNQQQISGFYTRIMRDEVVAEWRWGPAQPSLHVYCHVSGQQLWPLAPPKLRNFIFQRELPLVRVCCLLCIWIAAVRGNLRAGGAQMPCTTVHCILLLSLCSFNALHGMAWPCHASYYFHVAMSCTVHFQHRACLACLAPVRDTVCDSCRRFWTRCFTLIASS